jgi:hypothetical protein
VFLFTVKNNPFGDFQGLIFAIDELVKMVINLRASSVAGRNNLLHS